MNKILKIKLKYLGIFFLLPIVVLIFLNISSVANLDLVEGDTASLVVMATAPIYGLGVPYNNLWEMKPPGIFLLVGLLIKFFGFSMILLKTIQALLLLGTAVFSYLILKKIFSSFYTFLVGWSALAVVCSSYLFGVFLPSELFGLFFSLSGLTVLLYLKGFGKRFFLASFFLALSGQMKDPFGLTNLAVLPPLIFLLAQRSFKKFFTALMASLAGIMTVVLIILAYLQILGAFNSYLGVLNFKAEVFHVGDLTRILGNFQYATQKFQDTVIYFQYYNTVPLIIWGLATAFIYFKSKIMTLTRGKTGLTVKLKITISPHTSDVLTVLFYSLGSFLGFAAGGQVGGHYAIQAVLPLFFVQGAFFNSVFENSKHLFNTQTGKILAGAAVLAVSFVFLMSKPTYLKADVINLFSGKSNPVTVIKQIYASDRKIGDWLKEGDKEKIDKNSCILKLYGWGTGTTYFYSQLRPCSRFFLVNIIRLDWQRQEYRKSLTTNPPAAIFYSREGADMSVDNFEEQVINIFQILKNCYTAPADPYRAYFPLFTDKQALKNCWEKYQ